MAISDRLNKLTTDITNAYTSIENKLPKILPEGYTQVEYIESTGTQYIDTGVKLNQNSRVKIKYQYSAGSSTVRVLGDAHNTSKGWILTTQDGTINTKIQTLYGDTWKPQTNEPQSIIPSTNIVEFERNGVNQYVNNNLYYTNRSSNFETTSTAIVFGAYYNSLSLSSIKLYELWIWEDGTNISRHFQPCYRKSDNKPGLYDTVTKEFYTNQGTGTFLKGYDTAIGMDKNTENLSTAIDSIEIIKEQSAEGESLLLTNTKAMPYNDYVVEGKSEQDGEPIPSYPSEIHSVADDVNLLDISKITTTGAITNNGDGTITITNSYSTSTTKKLSVLAPNLKVGDTYILNLETTGTNKFIYLYGTNESWDVGTTRTITQSDLDSYVFVYGKNNQTVTISGIKIAKGTTLTPCSPYNQGTVTIKQETVKNYLDWNKFIDYSNWTNSNSPGYKSFEITGLDINKTYTLCRTDTAGYGETSKYAGFNKGNNNGNMFLHSTDSSRNLQSVSDTPSEDGKIYITMYMSSQSDLNDYINIIKKCWVIEGTEYQEYVNNNYTIQTEPLRSLPNGVKDTIEAEQHRKIGRQTGTLTETTTITLSDAKTNGAYMCNIKPSGTLTGKTIELEAGDYEIIYELEEEIIEPLTQNQATTMLDIIKTGSYEGTTNIYTDEDVKPTIGVGYYKKA